ncbi:hypothetical protein ACB092_05G223100 [Castanea dentata]
MEVLHSHQNFSNFYFLLPYFHFFVGFSVCLISLLLILVRSSPTYSWFRSWRQLVSWIYVINIHLPFRKLEDSEAAKQYCAKIGRPDAYMQMVRSQCLRLLFAFYKIMENHWILCKFWSDLHERVDIVACLGEMGFYYMRPIYVEMLCPLLYHLILDPLDF